MMKHYADVELAILGGGCAGLSLAKRLALNPAWQRHTCIIEQRNEYTHDRSWCFWNPLDSELASYLAPLIKRRWSEWRFSGSNFSSLHQTKDREYCYIPADEFYQDAIRYIDNHPTMQLYNGETVIEVINSQSGYIINLANGASFHAQYIVDTRPPLYAVSRQAKLWQLFFGLEIKTANNCFDETTVGIMEDLTVAQNATQFMYVLPFSSQQALIECTVFSRDLYSPATLESHLLNWLNHKIRKEKYEVIRSEQGCLPMGLTKLSSSNRKNYSYAGQSAGALRAATGYGFIRIQDWARACSVKLIESNYLQATRKSKLLLNTLDTVFLRVLHDTPSLGVSLFQMLAQRVPPESLVRFMSDEGRVIDYWRIARALPTWRFLIYSLALHPFFYAKEEYE